MEIYGGVEVIEKVWRTVEKTVPRLDFNDTVFERLEDVKGLTVLWTRDAETDASCVELDPLLDMKV